MMRKFQKLHINERIPSVEEITHRYPLWAPPIYSTGDLTQAEQYEATEIANKISGKFKSIVCIPDHDLIKIFPLNYDLIERGA